MTIRDALGMIVDTHPRRQGESSPVVQKLYLTETVIVVEDIVLVYQYFLAVRKHTRKLYIHIEIHTLSRHKGNEIGYSQMDMELTHHIKIKGKRLSDFIIEKMDQVFDTLY